MTVIAVGHTPAKFDRLLSMIPDYFTVVKVFNGLEPRNDSINTPNCPKGRDVAMYAEGLNWLPEQVSPRNENILFLNDDVVHLSPDFWRYATHFLNKNEFVEIAGVANLASWVCHSRLTGPMLATAQKQGVEPQFIRTSAFLTRRAYFERLWATSAGDAQVFEKSTMKYASVVSIIKPQWAYDSNLEPYV